MPTEIHFLSHEPSRIERAFADLHDAFSSNPLPRSIAQAPRGAEKLIDLIYSKGDYRAKILKKFDIEAPALKDKKRAIVAFSGGKDSIAAALKLRSEGISVKLLHVLGINRSFMHEIHAAKRAAELMQMPIETVRIAIRGKSIDEWRENPFRNCLIMAICAARGADDSSAIYALGNHTIASIKEIALECGLSDSMEIIEATAEYLGSVFKGYEQRYPLRNFSESLLTILRFGGLELMEASSSCMMPERFKKAHRNNALKVYKGKLLEGRCGSCYKCSLEWIILSRAGKAEPDERFEERAKRIILKAFHDHRLEFGGERSDQEVLEHYIDQKAIDEYRAEKKIAPQIQSIPIASILRNIEEANIPLSKLRAWPENPKSVMKKDFERLLRQMKRLGVYKRLLVCPEYEEDHPRDGFVVLGGMSRLRALQELGAPIAGCTVVHPKSAAERIEYALSDNDQIGRYDEGKLAEIVFPFQSDIHLEDFKIDLGNPISLGPLIERVGPGGEEESEAVAEIFSASQIRAALEESILEIDYKELMKAIISPPTAMMQFNQLCAGKRDGLWISLLHNPHRVEIPCVQRRNAFRSIRERDRVYITTLAKFIADTRPRIDSIYSFYKYMSAGSAGAQYANEFPPYLARELILRYTRGKSRFSVLDPCHGWGGRMLGALATLKRVRYVGCDPAERTNRGARALAAFIMRAEALQKIKPECELINKAFEDAKIAEKFDFALTSPPYYDYEKYESSPNQAMIRYKSYQEFRDKFLKALISKSISLLKPGCALVLNVSAKKYDMRSDVFSLARALGFKAKDIETRFKIGTPSGIGARTSAEDSDVLGEPLIEIVK